MYKSFHFLFCIEHHMNLNIILLYLSAVIRVLSDIN